MRLLMRPLKYLALSRADLCPLQGTHIQEAVNEAIMFAREHEIGSGPIVYFKFEDVSIKVKPTSVTGLIVRDWRRARYGCILPEVGPFCEQELSEGVKANDQIVKDAYTRLRNAPSLQVVDQRRWSDFAVDLPFSMAAIGHMDRWGRLMQIEIDKGSKVADIAAGCAQRAGLPDLSEKEACRMSIMSLNGLVEVWLYGDELRDWALKEFTFSQGKFVIDYEHELPSWSNVWGFSLKN